MPTERDEWLSEWEFVLSGGQVVNGERQNALNGRGL